MAYGNIIGQKPTADVPVGAIILWSGAQTAIPTNWKLCDGTNGTPDLRGQFVIGAGGNYEVGNTGGESTHTLTIDEMPEHSHVLNLSNLRTTTTGSHTHTFSVSPGVNGGTSPVGGGTGVNPSSKNISSSGSHYHNITGAGSIDFSGGSQPHNNLPPYYALCYIMKIS